MVIKMNLTNDEKHYNTLANYYFNKYHEKVAKISLNAGFSCPNKDGKKGYGGCTYCSKSGSGDFAGSPNDDLKTQFLSIKKIIAKNGLKPYIYLTFKQTQIPMVISIDLKKYIMNC